MAGNERLVELVMLVVMDMNDFVACSEGFVDDSDVL